MKSASGRLSDYEVRPTAALSPNVGAKRCHTKHTGGLMLQKQIVDGPSLAARRFQHSATPAYLIV